MCGRYVRRSDKQTIAECFHAKPQPAELPMPPADYNIAPTTFQPIIRQSREAGEREMILARWGLVRPGVVHQLPAVVPLSSRRRHDVCSIDCDRYERTLHLLTTEVTVLTLLAETLSARSEKRRCLSTDAILRCYFRESS